MKDTRFEFWNYKTKEIEDVVAMDFAPNSHIIICTISGNWEYRDDVGIDGELRQSTGLVDKNGKCIFQGDICSITEVGVTDMSDPDPFKRVIKWNDEKGGFDHYRIDGKEGGSGWSFYQRPVGKYYEVIGNIYENPELLKVSKE